MNQQPSKMPDTSGQKAVSAQLSALQKQVAELLSLKDLTERVTQLEAQISALLPKCHHCGKPARNQERLELGRVKYVIDVWSCDACKGLGVRNVAA